MDFHDKDNYFEQAQQQQAEMMREQTDQAHYTSNTANPYNQPDTQTDPAPAYQTYHTQQTGYQPQSVHQQATPFTAQQQGYQVPPMGAQQQFVPQAQQAQQQPLQAHQPLQQSYYDFTTDTQAKQTFDAWQQHSGKHERKKRKFPRHLGKILGGIAAAVAIFCGGLMVGGAFESQSQAVPEQVESTTATLTIDENLPSVSISSTPTSSASSSADGVLTGEEIYAKNTNSVVSIQAIQLSTGESGTGSGVIMSEDGYVITNAHVITDTTTELPVSKVNVILADGTSLPASIVGYDTTTDLAVLKVTTDLTLEPAEFGDSDALLPGADCYTIGSPSGLLLANTITGGTISALNRDITIDDRVMTLIQIDASINPGNSGGALINQYGQVVGITSAKLGIGSYEGLGFAIPINDAAEVVDALIQYGYVPGRPQIGLTGYDINEASATAYGVPQGVLVDSVDSRSNATLAGLQANDILIGVNGTTITCMDEINAIKDTMSAGEQISITVYRIGDGREYTFTFALNDAYDFEGTDPAESTITTNDQSQQSQSSSGYNNYFSNPFGAFMEP